MAIATGIQTRRRWKISEKQCGVDLIIVLRFEVFTAVWINKQIF
jgi:hypothetical protein